MLKEHSAIKMQKERSSQSILSQANLVTFQTMTLTGLKLLYRAHAVTQFSVHLLVTCAQLIADLAWAV